MRSVARQLLIEIAKRRPVTVESQRDAAAELAARMRAWYHPKQGAYFTSKAKRRVTKKTRRAGATSGGCHEFIARAVEYPGWRGTYVTSTRREARERAWINDTRSGLVDVLRHYGTMVDNPAIEIQMLGGVRAEIRDQAMTIDFSNGSRIDLFGADDERAMRKQRGLAKHVYWIDEAQDFRFLDRFYDAVIINSLSDYNGECWLSGTPGRDCAGMFYEASKDDEADGPRLPNWEVHTIAQVDNPFFGRLVGGTVDGKLQYFVEDNVGERTGPFSGFLEAEKHAVEVRWERTAGAVMKEKGWRGDEPDFIRECLGRWVREDARYVYPVHTVPTYDLFYAPQRLKRNPFTSEHDRFRDHPQWLDVKRAVVDLPKHKNRRRQWMYAIGADFGYNPDPFAIVVWAFAHDTQDVYELFSWKALRVHTDDQGRYLKQIWDDLDNVVALVGDPAGKQDDFEVWRTRLGLPIDEANKRGKNTLEEFLADDIRRRRVHLRVDSPLYDEMKHLLYLPTKPGKTREAFKHRRLQDGRVPGDHCCFVAGTPVLTPQGPQPIEKLRVGAQALTRDGWRAVTAAWKTGRRQLWRLETDDGRELVGTADHPVWTEFGWKALSDLTPGVTLTSCSLKSQCFRTDATVQIVVVPTRVRTVEPLHEEGDVYNITVDDAHEFFANGVLVSNCDAARYAYSALTHFMSRIPGDKPEPGTPAALHAEEERIESKIDAEDRRRAERAAEGDEDVLEDSFYDYLE